MDFEVSWDKLEVIRFDLVDFSSHCIYLAAAKWIASCICLIGRRRGNSLSKNSSFCYQLSYCCLSVMSVLVKSLNLFSTFYFTIGWHFFIPWKKFCSSNFNNKTLTTAVLALQNTSFWVLYSYRGKKTNIHTSYQWKDLLQKDNWAPKLQTNPRSSWLIFFFFMPPLHLLQVLEIWWCWSSSVIPAPLFSFSIPGRSCSTVKDREAGKS